MSISNKFALAESTRPDVLQLFHAFTQAFKSAGMDYLASIDKKIDEFNARSNSGTAAQKISDQEAQILKLLPLQQAEFLDVLSRHWDVYKAVESGITLKSLCCNVGRKAPQPESSLWTSIYQATPEKNLLWLKRQVAIFEKNVEDVQKQAKKVVNLAFRAVTELK